MMAHISFQLWFILLWGPSLSLVTRVVPLRRQYTKLRAIRECEIKDLSALVKVAHKEFESEYSTSIEKQGLWFMLWIGFYLRLNNERNDDHRVFIDVNNSGAIRGMVEISQQPMNWYSNAIPIPYVLKSLVANELQPYLSNLLVAKEYRKRGLGRKLVAQSVRIVQNNWHADRLGLHYDTSNSYLKRFYSRLGFVRDPHGDTTTDDGIQLTYAVKRLPPVTSRRPATFLSPSSFANGLFAER